MVHQKKAGRPVPLAKYGPLVKRLRHRPLTPVTGVRFPHGSPKESNEITIESNPRGKILPRCGRNAAKRQRGFAREARERKERLPGAGFQRKVVSTEVRGGSVYNTRSIPPRVTKKIVTR